MNVLIMPNYDKNNSVSCTNRVCLKLNELGAVCLMTFKDKSFIDEPFILYDDFNSQLSKADVIIAIGGDGTIIHSSKHAVNRDIPVLGINAGRLGFLASIEQDELDFLSKLVDGSYNTENRMLLKINIVNQHTSRQYLALNDVVISKGALARVVDIDIFCMDKYVSSYRADGVIFATPTGSTAYSLSAGGPVIETSLDVITMTPICPHSLFARTIIFASDNVLKIRVGENSTSTTYITIDGEDAIMFNKGDSLTISMSQKHVKMITLYDKPFYEVLNKKILTRADSMVEEMGR